MDSAWIHPGCSSPLRRSTRSPSWALQSGQAEANGSRSSPTANASKPSFTVSVSSPIATLTVSGITSSVVARTRGPGLVVLLHWWWSPSGRCSWRTPDTYHPAGLRRGPPPQLPRLLGQPLGIREHEYRHLDEAFVRTAPHVLGRSVSDGHREPSVATVRHVSDASGWVETSDSGRAFPDTALRTPRCARTGTSPKLRRAHERAVSASLLGAMHH